VSLVSYYTACSASTWDATWPFAGDKASWGIAVAAGRAVLAAVRAKWVGNSWRPVLITGLFGAVGAPLIAFIGLFAVNLLGFPLIHEVNLDTITKRIEALEKRPIAGALDARAPELVGKVSNLEAKVRSLDDLIRTQNCLDRFNSKYPKELVDIILGNARQFVKTSPNITQDGGSEWNTLLTASARASGSAKCCRLAVQPCGSARGRELGRRGRRCGEVYRRRHAVSGAD
jgi:hypothetical protein